MSPPTAHPRWAEPAPPPSVQQQAESVGHQLLSNTVWVGVVLAVSVGAGYVLAQHSPGLLHDRMLPWILSRCLGLAAYVALCALVALGIWFRHPWRVHRRTPGPQALLRAHVALAGSTVVLLAGHVAAVALDSFAHVGWTGAFVPWHSQYRPTAVALGSMAMYGIIVVAGTAALAGSIARRGLATDPFDLGRHFRPLPGPRSAVG